MRNISGLPSQQSATESQLLALDEKSPLQLLFPHFRPVAQCVSPSQSPSPTLHGFDAVQQSQSVLGIPLHVEVGGGVVGGPVRNMINHLYVGIPNIYKACIYILHTHRHSNQHQSSN